MKPFYLLVFIFCFLQERVYGDEEIVTINEICIKSDKDDPRWIELRNLSKEQVNLKGWSLKDMNSCFYKFTQDLLLKQNQLLLLCFYEGNKTSFDFQKDLPKETGLIISEMNCSPFSGKGLFEVENNKSLEEWVGYWQKLGNQADAQIKNHVGKNYDYYRKEATSYLKKKGYPDKYLYPIMDLMSSMILDSDEVALINSNGTLVSYVNWGNVRPVKQEDFKFEKDAISLGIWDKIRHPFPDEIKKIKTLILERISKDRFECVLPGSPGCLLNKGKLLEVYYSTGVFGFIYKTAMTSQRWWLRLELSIDKDFKTVDYIKTFNIINDVSQIYAPVDGNDLEWLSRKNNKIVYYRLKRIFDDGDCSEWKYPEKPLDLGTIIVDYKVKNIEGLIQLQEKEIKERYFEEFKRLKDNEK